MFTTKSSKSDDIFSSADIQRLIETFPPQDSSLAKERLVRSYSGRNLVRSNAIVKRFRAQIDSAPYALPVSKLSASLGIQDIRWLLDQEEPSLFFTRDRERILPKQQQVEICSKLRNVFQKDEGLDLGRWAGQYDLSTDTLQRMISGDPALANTTLDNGLTYSDMKLQQAQATILEHLQSSGDAVVNVSGGKGFTRQLPSSFLARILQDIVGDDDNEVEGNVEQRSDGLYFVPHAAISALRKQKNEAKKAWLEESLRALGRHGYCYSATVHHPALLEDVTSDLDQDLEVTYHKEHPKETLTRLGSSPYIFLAREGPLAKMKDELVRGASEVADHLWELRSPGQDFVYDQEAFLKGMGPAPKRNSAPTTRDFQHAILLSEHAEAIKAAFEKNILRLQNATTERFSIILRTRLLATLQLHTAGVETIADPTLQSRVSEFVTDWARRTQVPDVLATIKEQKLLVAKTNVREVDKFAEAVQAAKTLAEINSAAARLARKTKIDQPDAATLAEVKRAALKEKVDGLRKMKRGSDLLQKVTWILLATIKDGLFTSSGKDTSRMIKLFQSDGDADIAKRLGELRDLVKEGKDGEAERLEMREMAKTAIENMG